MSSIPEERNIILQENIPKLLTKLTGFKPGDENFKICLQFSWSMLKHHRFLSLNSHEVKRDIEGICEKLKLNNFHDEEKQFRKIVEETLSHELAVDHYEKDVMYGIVSLLISLAYDPISKLKDKKRRGIPIFHTPKISEEAKRSSDNFISLLLKDNFELSKNETDSDLSEWTESEDEDQKQKSLEEVVNEKSAPHQANNSSLKPPQKIPWYETKKIENAEKWLKENLQHSWWSPKEVTSLEISSTHPAANFCHDWQRHLSKKSMGFIKPQPISLLTENCLLREILWMFINPVDCKFFKLEDEVITLRPNVSMRSTSVESLQIFLADFVRSININYNLKKSIEKSIKTSLGHTLEKYFRLLQKFIDEIMDLVLNEEEIVKTQSETYTTLTLHNKMRPHFKMFEMLWDVHKNCIFSEEKFAPHIRASYLIANLNFLIQNAACKEKKNLCLTFLVTCLKTFFDIFEIWWTEARLQDLQSEFVVERITSNIEDLEIIQPRLFEKNKERSFYINDLISKRIKNDSIISVMRYYASEASFTLEIISKLDRIHEMKQIGNGDVKSMYEKFMEKFRSEILKYSSNEVVKDIQESTSTKSETQEKNQKLIDDIRSEMLAEGDDLMLQIFSSTFESLLGKKKVEICEESPLDLYYMLNKSTNSLLLPLEQTIDRIIKDLLAAKISIAERFVMDIYINEFTVGHLMHDIRKVFFMESSDLMIYLTMKLFPQMETADNSWANSYLLTSAFNEAVGGRINSVEFLVQMNRKNSFYSVLEAIDEISIYVNMNHQHNLDNIFTSKAIQKYNDVFRFLLKIKWGQRILNCLVFPDFFRHRLPYAKLSMLDLVIKRLALTRFSMLQAINTIHNRLMVMLQGLSHHLDLNVSKTQKITELIAQHDNFVNTFYRNTFMDENSKRTRGIIIEVLKLAKVIKDEWNNVETFATLDAAGKIDDSASLVKLNLNTIEIEKAFNACENQLRDLLD